MLRELISRMRAMLRPNQLDREFDSELDGHLQMLTERFIRQGMTPAEAYHAARRQFGGVLMIKEELRQRRGLISFDVVLQDVRHAFRQLRLAKWFTATAALTLALGIGAGTAVFAVFDNVILRPLPFTEPDRLMAFRSIDRRGPHLTNLSYPSFFDYRAQNQVFDHLVGYRSSRFTLTDSMPAVQVPGQLVSWDLFATLGVSPELGRGFQADEEKRGAHAVVLSHGLWQRRFGGDRGIVGRYVHINGKLFLVTGVAPAGFHFPVDDPDTSLWVTIAEDAAAGEFTPLFEQRGARVLDAIGRLKPGVTAEQARLQLDQIGSALAHAYPDDCKNVAATSVAPELERLTGKSRKPLWILLGAVGMVLLIACANVANLLLVRSTERAREFTVRTAVGASRPALVRQLLIESLALGLVGSGGGLLLAVGILKAILPLAGDAIPRLAQTAVDGRVLFFSAALAIITSVLFTVTPAIQVTGADLAASLKEGAQNIARGSNRLRSVLIVTQIALGLVLVAGAEMLISNFLHLVNRNPGFRPDHLLTFEIGLSDDYDMAKETAFSDRLLQRLRAIPGAKSVSTGFPLPLEGDEMSVSFDIEERPAAPPDRPHSDIAIVNPGYFRTMGITLLDGRDFDEHDTTSSPRVVVVNDAFARKYFPGENVIGKRIKPGATNGKERVVAREIVGVVGNAKQVPLGPDADPIYYFPFKQLSWDIGKVVIRTTAPPLQMEAAARGVLAGIDREAPMYRVRTGDELASSALGAPRFQMVLMGAFAAIALLLTVGGLYGVLSYSVARRHREIGVRMALGADQRQVLGLILFEAAGLMGAGIAIGFAGVAGLGQLLTSMIYEIRPEQVTIVAGACGVMIVAGLIAAYLPAARAAAVEPMEALRSE